MYFALDANKAIVDLPGYGFARVPHNVKKHWHALMESYFNQRQQLKGLVLVMDIRHPMREFDEQMLNWCRYADTPVHILLTKADKLSHGAAKTVMLQVKKQLQDLEHPNVSIQIFSSLKRSGAEIVMKKMDDWLAYPEYSAETTSRPEQVASRQTTSTDKRKVKAGAATTKNKPRSHQKAKPTKKPKKKK